MFKILAVGLVQAGFVVVLAPLVAGAIKKAKAFLQTRRGPAVYQPYLDLYKLVQKESVMSEHASWIFLVTPFVYFGAMVAAALVIPVVATSGPLMFTGDVVMLLYLFAMARFFLALAGLDAGSAFGGMASSREMAMSSMAEPVMMLVLFTLALAAGTSNIAGIIQFVNNNGLAALAPGHLMALGALFVAVVAETGRVPVDNPDTHLELTMIHEGMLLEYSGKLLALLTLGASIRQLLFFALLANLFFPWGIAENLDFTALALGALAFSAKVLVIGLIMVVLETSMAKMRLFKVPDLLLGAFLIAFFGLLSTMLFGGN